MEEPVDKPWPLGHAMVLTRLAYCYNPTKTGCHPSYNKISELCGGYSNASVRKAILRARQELGLRWIYIIGNGMSNRGNSYDFRHILSGAMPAFAHGHGYRFKGEANIFEPFEGKTLSFKPKVFDPFKLSGQEKKATGGAPCQDYRSWFTRAINNGSGELAEAIGDHRRILDVSEQDEWKNVKGVISSRHDEAARVELVRYCTKKGYKVIDPEKWIGKDSVDANAEALKDALR